MVWSVVLAPFMQDPEAPASLEFLRQMTALDVLFVLFWVGAVVYGVRTGVIRQLIWIIALFMGALVGALIAGPASVWGGIATGSTRSAALPGTYAVVVILITLAIYFIAVKVYPETRLGRYEMIDRITGGILGFMSGLVGISVMVGVLIVATSAPWPVLDETRASIRLQLASTPFLPLIATSFPLVTQLIGNSLPVSPKEVCERCL
jgi:uncharacterized membrane protein required for colicin V production